MEKSVGDNAESAVEQKEFSRSGVYFLDCPNGCDLSKPGQIIRCDSLEGNGPFYCPNCSSVLKYSGVVEMGKQKWMFNVLLGNSIMYVVGDDYQDSHDDGLTIFDEGELVARFTPGAMSGWFRTKRVD